MEKNREKYVIDTSALLESDILPEGELYMSPGVYSEIKSTDAQMRLLPYNIKVKKPSKKYIDIVKNAIKKTGYPSLISSADTEIISLALELHLPLITNDFGIQNILELLGIEYISPRDKIKHPVTWIGLCSDCGSPLKNTDLCGICGGKIRYKMIRTKEKI